MEHQNYSVLFIKNELSKPYICLYCSDNYIRYKNKVTKCITHVITMTIEDKKFLNMVLAQINEQIEIIQQTQNDIKNRIHK